MHKLIQYSKNTTKKKGKLWSSGDHTTINVSSHALTETQITLLKQKIQNNLIRCVLKKMHELKLTQIELF